MSRSDPPDLMADLEDGFKRLKAERQAAAELTPEQARDAVLAGKVVRAVTGTDPEDPICLQYIDHVREFDFEPEVFTESVGGWSHGSKEAVCAPNDSFLLEWLDGHHSLTIEDAEPPQKGVYS